MAKRWLLLSGLLVLAGFLALLPVPRIDGHIAGSDGLCYFAVLRSVAVDHDLDLANDYALLGVEPYAPTPLGRPGAPFSVGTPVLWAPFFALAGLVSVIAPALGGAGGAPGTGALFESFVCVATILYAIAGLWLVFRTVRKVLDDEFAAACAALAMWWATSLIEYTLAEPSMSHGASFFVNAVFLALWCRPRTYGTLRPWLEMGAAAGLVALVRTQEAPLVLLPACAIVADAARGRVPVGRAVAALARFGTAFGLVFLPQVMFWHAVYGAWFTVPQGNDFMRWGSPQPDLILFSGRHGLITWHPVILLALFGLVPLWHTDKRLARSVAAVFLMQLYVNSVVSQWWAGDAFGGRRFCGVLPWLALPLGAAAMQAAAARGRTFVGCVLLAFLLWNGLSLAQYRLGFVSRSERLTWRQLTVDRLVVPVTILRRALHR